MDTQTDHWVETLTGLGGTGAQILVAYAGNHPTQGHPLIPILQITTENTTPYAKDFDLILQTTPEKNAEAIIHSIIKVASRQYTPQTQGNTDFQFTRGLLGVSM
jgi:altronate dehydratase